MDLVVPSVSELPVLPETINTDQEWNAASVAQYTYLGAMFANVNTAESYLNSLYTALSSRISESERRLHELEGNLKVLRTITRSDATTSINIRGGDASWVDTDPKFYRDVGILEKVQDEGVFRLSDTGFFSSLRSLGGYAGTISLDNQLGHIDMLGSIYNITDGSRSSFWMGTFYSPAPIRADQNDIPWLPDDYKHGFAFQLTYSLDRPTYATEIFIDPVTTEPFDLVAVQWTPLGITNIIDNYSFSSTGDWQFNGNAYIATGIGIDSSSGLVTRSSSGFASYTFDLLASITRSVSGTLVATTSGDILGTRLELNWNMRGRGDCYSGARIVWLDSSGDVITYKLSQDYPTGFWKGYSLAANVPPLAASGRIDLGIFTAAPAGSAFFDDIALYLGEQNFSCNEKIDRPTTISLPRPVLSSRFTFTLCQRNPRRETLSKEAASITFTPIQGLKEIDSNLQKATQSLANSLQDPGPGDTVFAYKLGIKELDLRYREHFPRGSLVSIPINATKEIRRMWVTTELGKRDTSGVTFYIYPFANDEKFKTEIEPFRSGELDASFTSATQEGQVIHIFTTEEVASGWANNVNYPLIVDPRTVVENFDGTDRDGKLKLQFAPHLRRPLLKGIEEWLVDYSIWPTTFDPNAENLYGLADSTLKDRIRTNTASGDISGGATMETRAGYIPLKVTVITDKWVAHPDTFGRPDLSKVRSQTGETLQETSVVSTQVEESTVPISFDAWASTTTIDAFLSLTNMYPPSMRGLFTGITNRTQTLKQYLDALIIIPIEDSKIGQISFQRDRNPAHKNARQKLKGIYNLLKRSNKLSSSVNVTNTVTSSVAKDDVFKTRFAPLITGPSGTFIRLFWYNATTNEYLPISQNAYTVDAVLGQITMLSAAPSSGFASIVADYKYLSNSAVEDYFSVILDYGASASSGTAEDTAGLFRTISRNFPITRNMTDYTNGKIPDLKEPNFDRLAKDYYPIIEFYVNSSGELIFARDFFKYGEEPARLIVEYDTLGLTPRVGVEVLRAGAPSVTSIIKSVSLRVKESSASPTRESI